MAPSCSRVDNERERGLASVQFVLSAALAMLLVVGLVQVVAYQYVRGAVVAALERGVRTGSLVGSGASECLEGIDDSLRQILDGAVGSDLSVSCVAGPSGVVASAAGVVPSWLGGLPDMPFDVEVTATRESGS